MQIRMKPILLGVLCALVSLTPAYADEAKPTQANTDTWYSSTGAYDSGGKELSRSQATKLNTNTMTILSESSKRPQAGDIITVTATCSTTNPNAEITAYTWFVDGKPVQSGYMYAQAAAQAAYSFVYRGTPITVSCSFDGEVAVDDALRWDVGTFTTTTDQINIPSSAQKGTSGDFIIQAEPTDTSANAGDAFQLHVAASGPSLTYQWYMTSKAGTGDDRAVKGATGPTLRLQAMPEGNNASFYCVVSSGAKAHKTAAATVTVFSAPTINTQPQSTGVCKGSFATFTMTATGSVPTKQSFLWELSKDGGDTWFLATAGTGERTNALTTGAVTPDMNGWLYRCRSDNGQYSVVSKAAELTVYTKPKITGQPKSTVALEGTRAELSVNVAAGRGPDPQLTYTWYLTESVEPANGKPFPNANSATLSLPEVSAQLDGKYIYCVVDNGAFQATSDAVAVAVYGQPDAPAITVLDIESQGSAITWTGPSVAFTMTTPVELAGQGSLRVDYSLDDGATWMQGYKPGTVVNVPVVPEGGLRVQAQSSNPDAPDPAKSVRTVRTVLQPDITAPSVTVAGNPTSWQKGPITIELISTDMEAGLSAQAYSWDGGKTWTSELSRRFDRNQKVRALVRDAVGNTATRDIDIILVDSTLPPVTVSGNPTTWTQDTVTLHISAGDAQSGLATAPYSWDGGRTWGVTSSRDFTGNQIVDIQVKDAAGNVSSLVVPITKIDSTGPTCLVEGNPDTWSNQKRTITIQAEDRVSGLHRAPYSWDGGRNWTSNPSKTVTENGDYSAVIRDVAGNQTPLTIIVDKLDMTVPEPFAVTGVPIEWTNQDITLKVEDANDLASGLDVAAYNWNNEGWTASAAYTVTANGVITVAVRDRAGNERMDSIVIEKMDREPPVIAGILGNPTDWQNTPATITVSATDTLSGLAPEAYSFDDGATWQPTPFATFISNQAVGLKVRDAAGNVTYSPFLVTTVDAKPPELTVSTLSVSDDRKYVVVGVYGIDNEPGALQYCSNYDELAAETAEWTVENEYACPVGQEITVACMDVMGNVGLRTFKPMPYAFGGGSSSNKFTLITQGSLPIAGYTLGGLPDSKTGIFIDNAGIRHEYRSYRVDGQTVTGIAVEVEAFPAGGGYLSGYARLNGIESPIYWDKECTLTVTKEGCSGVFFLNPALLRTSAKTAMVQVHVAEYEDEGLTKKLNGDTISASVMIDINPPLVSMSMDKQTNQVTVTATDVLSGIATLQYQLSTGNGVTNWMDYSIPITLTTSGKVNVRAVDKVGNVKIATSSDLLVAGSVAEQAPAYEDSYFYRTSLFNHYLLGTGKTAIGTAK